MASPGAIWAILRKDLTVELRTRESVPAMVLFALSTMIVFHFGLRRNLLAGNLAAGVLWVTLLFAAILAINRLFVAEREQSGFDGILLSPIDRNSLLVAKALALFAYLAVLELVAVPVFALFFLEINPGTDLLVLVAVLALADVGLATVGTLVASLSVGTRARDVLTPLMMLPLMVPMIIAAAAATAPTFTHTGGGGDLKWILVLGLYDTVFVLLAYAVFDYLVED